MRRNRTLAKRREGSSNWYCNFTVNGRRFRDSLGTDDQDTAEIIAAKIRSDALLGNLRGKKPEMTLDAAFVRYWEERIKGLPSAGPTRRRALALEAFLGKHTLLSEITKANLISYAASRRTGVIRDPRSSKERVITRSPLTINNELHLIGTILHRAANLWEVEVGED